MGATASAAAAAAPRAKTVLRCVALGDPVTDIVVAVDPAALAYLGAAPGSCVEARPSRDTHAQARSVLPRAALPGRTRFRRRPCGNAAR